MKKRIRALFLSITMLPTLSGCALSKENVINPKEETTVVHCTTTKEKTTTTPYTTQQKTTTEPKKEYIVEYYDPEETLKKSIKKGDVVITYYEDPENNTIQSISNYGKYEELVEGPDEEEYEITGQSIICFGKNKKISEVDTPECHEFYNESGKIVNHINKKPGIDGLLEETIYEYYEENGALRLTLHNKIFVYDNENFKRYTTITVNYYDKNNSSNYYTSDINLNIHSIYEDNELVYECPITYSIKIINLYDEPAIVVKDEKGNTVYKTLNRKQDDEIYSESYATNSQSIYPVSRTKTISSDSKI